MSTIQVLQITIPIRLVLEMISRQIFWTLNVNSKTLGETTNSYIANLAEPKPHRSTWTSLIHTHPVDADMGDDFHSSQIVADALTANVDN